jgi:hypothetical protein
VSLLALYLCGWRVLVHYGTSAVDVSVQSVGNILLLCATVSLFRYKELRKEGKLHKFMEKRRRKNSSKDHRWLPGRRSSAGADE